MANATATGTLAGACASPADDAACPGALWCFTGVASFNASDDALAAAFGRTEAGDAAPRGCLCSNYYGSSGPGCTQAGTARAQFLAAAGIILAVAYVAMGVAFLKDTITLHSAATKAKTNASKAPTNPAKRNKTSSTGGIATLLLLEGLLASCVNASGQALFVASALSPTEWVYVGGQKTSRYHIAGYSLYALGVSLVFMTSLSLALWWLEIAEASSKFQSVISSATRTKFRTALIAFEVVFILCSAVPIAAQRTVIAVFTSLGPIIAYVVASLAGYLRLRRVIESVVDVASPPGSPQHQSGGASSSTQAKYTRLIESMRRTTLQSLGASALWVVLSIAAAIPLLTTPDSKGGSRNSMGPPSFTGVPSLLVLIELMAAVLLSLLFAVWHNVHTNVVNRFAAHNHSATESGGGGSGHAAGHGVVVSPRAPAAGGASATGPSASASGRDLVPAANAPSSSVQSSAA